MKVKICGLTRKEDALLAEENRADFVGVVIAPESKKDVSYEVASDILSSVDLPGVVVTTSTSPEELERIVELVNPAYLQLHSGVSLGVVEEITGKVKLIKTISVSGEKDYKKIVDTYTRRVEYFLLDAAKGGSGKVLDWDICAKIVKHSEVPVFLAGGLTPENVQEGINAVKPYGVDVASGVEEKVGIKSADKVKRFIEVAKHG